MGQHVTGQTVAAGEGLVTNGTGGVLVDSVNSMHLKRYSQCQFDKKIDRKRKWGQFDNFLSVRVSKWGQIGTTTNKQIRLV